ncbi:RING variant domain [Trypanosoma vivax]|uniref:Uncharacterized protein n=1 Tax=Trypanosoma vivax (strain Y486) TaxID=1055687 RepID=G0TZR7_TRYVY|nr:hypothetical protein TRVL_08419 [Trypanosoma vivax]KAH8610830.1 RING variant domain [Trypanosoma vivax]CCC50095.1 conserved hypothetical protein [Trypanosoma vivax Y486]
MRTAAQRQELTVLVHHLLPALVIVIPFFAVAEGSEHRWLVPVDFHGQRVLKNPPLATGLLKARVLSSDEDEQPENWGNAEKMTDVVGQDDGPLSNSFEFRRAVLSHARGGWQNGEYTFSANGTAFYLNVTRNSQHLLFFEAHADNEVEIVTQLMDRRHYPNEHFGRCENMFVALQLSEVAQTVMDSNRSAVDADRGIENRTDDQENNRDERRVTYNMDLIQSSGAFFWNAVATVMDSSAFCKLISTFMLRIPAEREPRSYSLIVTVRSHPPSYIDDGSVCTMRVFAKQSSEKSQRYMRILFALVVPLGILVVSAPFTFSRIYLLPLYITDIDVIAWMIYPVIMLRDAIASCIATVYRALRERYARRRERERQRELEKRLQRLMEEERCESGNGKASRENEGDMQEWNGAREGPVANKVDSSSPPQQELYTLVDGSQCQGMRCVEEKEQRQSSVGGWRPCEVTTMNNEVFAVDMSNSKQPLLNSGHQLFDTSGNSHVKQSASCVSLSPRVPVSDDNNVGGSANGGNIVLMEEEEERVCRICHDEDDEKLISPCECTGSVRWVHRSCLDKWRIESMDRNVENVNNCEICKKPFSVNISAGVLLWGAFLNISLILLLIAVGVGMFVLISYAMRLSIGEMTCRAPWHQVAYNTTFSFDGMILTLFTHLVLTALAAFAYALVYGRWHMRAETILYVLEHQMLPEFWTRGNVAKVVGMFFIGIIQGLSLGLLLKFLLYQTSYVAWSWEASPCVGAILYMSHIIVGTNIAILIKRRANRRRADADTDIAVELGTESQAPAADGTAGQGQLAASAQPAGIAESTPQSGETPAVRHGDAAEMQLYNVVEFNPQNHPRGTTT